MGFSAPTGDMRLQTQRREPRLGGGEAKEPVQEGVEIAGRGLAVPGRSARLRPAGVLFPGPVLVEGPLSWPKNPSAEESAGQPR